MKLISSALLLICLVVPGWAASAFAQLAPISVPEIQMKNLPHDRSEAVSVFYAVGSNPTGVPFIRRVDAGPVRAEIHSDGSASVPATTVPRRGFQIFNYLVFVVHPSNIETAHICNAFGSIPSAEGVGSENCDSDYSKSIRTFYRKIRLTDDKTKIASVGFESIDGTSTIQVTFAKRAK